MLKNTISAKKVGRRLLSVLLCLLMSVSMLTLAIAEDADITVMGKEYTRDEIAAMPVTEQTHTRIDGNGDTVTTDVRGVALADLLEDVDDETVIVFGVLDNWGGISEYSLAKSELVDGDAILAYETMVDDEWSDYERETDNGIGYFGLFVEGMRPAHAVILIDVIEPDGEPADEPSEEPDGEPADEPEEEPGEEPDEDTTSEAWIGDATPDDYDFMISGLVDFPGFFTIEGLAECAADFEQTLEYSWVNNSGSTDTDTFTGIYIEDLLEEVMSLGAFAKGILVIANDGYNGAYFLNDGENGAYWADMDGNKVMLAWSGTASRTERDIIDYELPRLVVGQKDADDVNRSKWISDIVEIRVTAFGDLQSFVSEAPAIDALAVNGITDGVGGDRFAPAANLDRAMFVTLLGRALNKDAEPPSVDDRRFDDVDYDSWYGMHVEWAVDNGIVLGYEDGTFRPNAFLTVEHMLLMAERAGLGEIPESVADAEGNANRAQAAVILYTLMTQLEA